MKDFYPQYMKNSFNTLRQTAQYKNGQNILSDALQKKILNG